MLYHWHELDHEAVARTDATDQIASPSHAPIIRYNAEAALANARGMPLQFDDQSIALTAANDRRADKLAMRLRETGLGQLGEPKQRALPGHYGVMQQTFRHYRAALRWFAVCLLKIFERLTWKPRHSIRQGVSSCSHTMVSNDADYVSRTRNDAQGQRFNASSG